MPEVTIASHKWRKRTRDWSAVCDNTLKLDRSYGMVGNPSTLNEFGVCAPDCEVCVTPKGAIPTSPCSELAFGAGNPWPVVRCQIPGLFFDARVETWGDDLIPIMGPFWSKWPGIYGNDVNVGELFERLIEDKFSCMGQKVKNQFQIYNNRLWSRHAGRVQLNTRPPGTGNVIATVEAVRAIGRYIPSTPDAAVWGLVAATWEVRRSAALFPNSNPPPGTKLTLNLVGSFASEILGSAPYQNNTGRRAGMSTVFNNTIFRPAPPIPTTFPQTVELEIVRF